MISHISRKPGISPAHFAQAFDQNTMEEFWTATPGFALLCKLFTIRPAPSRLPRRPLAPFPNTPAIHPFPDHSELAVNNLWINPGNI